MLKIEMESYVRIGGRGLKNRTYPYMGGVENCQNHPYVINEWPFSHMGRMTDNRILKEIHESLSTGWRRNRILN